MRTTLFCLIYAALAVATQYPTQLQYQKKQVLQYNIHGYLDARGYDDTNTYSSGGGWSTLTGLMYLQVLDVDTDNKLYFMSMDMYNVDVEANDTNVPPSMRRSPYPDGTLTPLGDTAFVWYGWNGTVLNVGFDRNDPTFFIDVKIGAVNALQTHFLPVGDKAQLTTLDPLGKYVAQVEATGGNQLTITKNFTQADVERFTDPTVNPSNVLITAGTVSTVSLQGALTGAVVDEFVQLVNVNDGPSSAAAGATPNTTALDVFMSSGGRFQISLSSANAESPFNLTAIDEFLKSGDMVKTTLFEAGQMLVKAKAVHASRLADPDAAVDAALADPKNERAQWRVARYFAARPAEALMPLETRLKTGTAADAAAIMNLLGRIDTEGAQSLIVRYGVFSADDAIRRQAVMSSFSIFHPSGELISAMRLMSNEESALSRMALFALGSLYSRAAPSSAAADELLPRLKLALEENDVRAVSALLYAIANAGPDAVPADSLAGVLAGSPNAVQHALARPVGHLMQQYNALAPSADDSDFPFNRTWGGGVVVGGKKINAGFNATVFAGTNFNCNQTYFNYEVYGISASNVTLFRWHATSFYAETIYGLVNGQPAADHIIVKIFGKVFYDEPLPSVDCFQETIPIFSQTPGLNKQYTLWVSVIPVTFTATVTLNLNMDVEFQACLDKLSATVQLLPTATLSFSGGAEVNLLVVKAGVRLEGAFTSTLVPEVYVYGSECEVGVQATLQVPPQEVDLDGYSNIDICVLWVFDCHWGKEYDHKFLDWNYPGENKVLYNKEWKIQP